MKIVYPLSLCLLYTLSFSQNRAEVKAYYTAHNQILENLARSQDTSMYLEEMHTLIEENGKLYTRLTHHFSFMDLCIAREDYALAELIVKQSLKHSLIQHTAYRDMGEQDSTAKSRFFYSNRIQKLIRESSDDFLHLFNAFDLFKSLQLNALDVTDQFNRWMLEDPRLEGNDSVVNIILTYTDSTNLVRLYEYIEEYGYPKEEEVGYFPDFIILWHTYCRPCGSTYTLPNGQWYYDYLDSVYYNATLDGLYRNTSYAYIKDKSQTDTYGTETYSDCEWQGQKYVTWFQGKLGGDLYDAKNIDKHRADIYLPPYWVDAVINGWEIPADYPIPDSVVLKY